MTNARGPFGMGLKHFARAIPPCSSNGEVNSCLVHTSASAESKSGLSEIPTTAHNVVIAYLQQNSLL